MQVFHVRSIAKNRTRMAQLTSWRGGDHVLEVWHGGTDDHRYHSSVVTRLIDLRSDADHGYGDDGDDGDAISRPSMHLSALPNQAYFPVFSS